MGSWVLANDANALLIDTGNNGTRCFEAAVPISMANGVLSAYVIEAGVGLDQDNLIATFDGIDSTEGISPKLRLRLAGNNSLEIDEQDFTLWWTLTSGLDSMRATGEKQVTIKDGLLVHIGTQKDGHVELYANAQVKKVSAISSGGTEFSKDTSFDASDVIAKVLSKDGSTYMDINLVGLISKLDTEASLLKLAGYTPRSLLSDGIYNLTLSGLPLSSVTGENLSVSVTASIAPNPNRAPNFDALDETIVLTEDQPTVLTLNASDPENHELSFSVLHSDPSTVNATVDGNRITLTPAHNYNNTAGLTVQFKVSDGFDAYNLKNVKLVVTPEDDPATLTLDTAKVREGRSLRGNVLSNDSDIDSVLVVQSFTMFGIPDTFDASDEPVPINGQGRFSLNAQGNFVWETERGFSGDLPTVQYSTPRGEQGELKVTVVPEDEQLGPSQVSGKVVFWNPSTVGVMAGKHSMVDGVQLDALDELLTEVQSFTDKSGSFNLPGFQPSTLLPITIHKATTSAGQLVTDVKSAISLSDVLDALKIYLGKPVSNNSPYRYLAADFDGNGTINLSDILGILKRYLGKTDAVTPAWTFIDAQTDVSALGLGTGKAASPSALQHQFSDNSTSIDTQNWVAVLRGDVNGSWASITSDIDSVTHEQFLQLIGISSGSING